MSKESKDLFRATLVKSEFSDEVTLDVYMNESSLSNLTLEQIEKIYEDIVSVSNYICDCTVKNSKK